MDAAGRGRRPGRDAGPHQGNLAPGPRGLPLPDPAAGRSAAAPARSSATTNTVCRDRAPGSSPASTTRSARWRSRKASTSWRSMSAPRIDGTAQMARHRRCGTARSRRSSPTAAPLYGDLVGRWVAAKQGRSFKCLVLDLDNTLWGGVIGDDGMEGIVLGQGSPLGEAYVAFQEYARELSRRGIILAVCSKNDEANALEPFEKHPDMVLKRGDIACFVANWSEQGRQHPRHRGGAEYRPRLVWCSSTTTRSSGTWCARNCRWWRCPRSRDDPTGYPVALADAGYFEGLSVTDEDRERTGQYQGNKARDALKASVTDLPAYLRGLEMQLICEALRQDRPAAHRATHQQVEPVQPDDAPLHRRRRHRGDGRSGRVRPAAPPDWTGSATTASSPSSSAGCSANKDLLYRHLAHELPRARPPGRADHAEPDRQEAGKLGARRVVGEYIPTKKNGMVKDHYARLGFTVMETDPSGGSREHPGSGGVHAGRNIHPRSRGLSRWRPKPKSIRR